MAPIARFVALAFATIGSVLAYKPASSCPTVSSDGEPVGEFKNISGSAFTQCFRQLSFICENDASRFNGIDGGANVNSANLSLLSYGQAIC